MKEREGEREKRRVREKGQNTAFVNNETLVRGSGSAIDHKPAVSRGMYNCGLHAHPSME